VHNGRNKLNIKEIRKNLFLLDEGGMSTGYLIAGEKLPA